MIEFVIFISLLVIVFIFLIIFLRKDIFYVSGNGEYVLLSSGACQNGTKWVAYQCQVINGKGCLDEFGNLTYDIVLKQEGCLSNTITPVSSSLQLTDVSNNTLQSRDIEYVDCSQGCIEHKYYGSTIKGKNDASRLKIGEEREMNGYQVKKISQYVYSLNGEVNSLAAVNEMINAYPQARKVSREIKKEKECKLPIPFTKDCSAPHGKEGKVRGRCCPTCESKCYGYSRNGAEWISERWRKYTQGFISIVDPYLLFHANGVMFRSRDRRLSPTRMFFVPEEESMEYLSGYFYIFSPKQGWLSNDGVGEEKKLFYIKDDGLYDEDKIGNIQITPFDGDILIP